ncbi:MAG TPA: CerR family C-terminal domain-containing protein [Holophaga sp.]|nr:CerR family C-terminal domain-containing protein [Holophaga sp.]
MHTSSDFPQDTRRRLLESALVIFADKGFDGAGIRDIAERAKANSAMVQYHFGGKEGIYLEALRFAFEQGPQWIDQLPPVPAPGEADARARAIACVKDYLYSFLHDFMECHGTGKYLPTEVERSAHILWNREMQYPRPSTEAFIIWSISPFSNYLNACLRILRPDLDEEGILRMAMSIHAQTLWMHNHVELIRLIRGKAYDLADLDSLVDHFAQFSLRGLGIPEAMTPQGA